MFDGERQWRREGRIPLSKGNDDIRNRLETAYQLSEIISALLLLLLDADNLSRLGVIFNGVKKTPKQTTTTKKEKDFERHIASFRRYTSTLLAINQTIV